MHSEKSPEKVLCLTVLAVGAGCTGKGGKI